MRFWLLSFILLSCLVSSPPAKATTVLKVDVPTMTTTSEWVVRATVVGVHSVDLAHEGRGIFTDVQLSIREVYRGQRVPQHYVMRLIGGEGDHGKNLWIPGMPVFNAGEEVVLFLEKTSMGHIPCGLGQGVFRVTSDRRQNHWVKQAHQGVHMLRRNKEGRLVETAPILHSSIRLLDDLVSEVYVSQMP